jgi:hypothetical protein
MGVFAFLGHGLIFWRAFELLLRYSGAITGQVGVVLQRLPGRGIVVVADPEEATGK